MKQIRDIPTWKKATWIVGVLVGLIVLVAVTDSSNSDNKGPAPISETPVAETIPDPPRTPADIALDLDIERPALVAATCRVTKKDGKTAGLSRFASGYLKDDAKEVFPRVLDFCDLSKPAEEPKPAKKPKPASKAPSVETQVRQAIESSGLAMETNKVRDIYRMGNALEIHLVTPKGGLNGPSVDDLDDQAAGAFHAIYRDTDFKGTAFLFFEGGLVNAKTGQDAPDAQTGSFAMKKGDARQIDWSDEDTVRFGIDWSLYRTGASPAIRGS